MLYLFSYSGSRAGVISVLVANVHFYWLQHENIVRVLEIVAPGNLESFRELCVIFEKCEMDLRVFIGQNIILELYQTVNGHTSCASEPKPYRL